jgi:bacillithiol system protein YtxJ
VGSSQSIKGFTSSFRFMQQLLTPQHVDAVFTKSTNLPVLLFKHSTQCPVSTRAKTVVETVARTHNGVVFALVHVIEERSVSNAIAERTGIRHESPQLILIRNGEARWHANHGAITVAAIDAALST